MPLKVYINHTGASLSDRETFLGTQGKGAIAMVVSEGRPGAHAFLLRFTLIVTNVSVAFNAIVAPNPIIL